MKIRTVVVDDEKPARDRLKRFLAEHADFEVVGEAGDGESAVRVIDSLRPDLVFLDVRMPEADGFQVLERLEHVPRVVFATAYERYAVQAFEVHSIDYLLKPFRSGPLRRGPRPRARRDAQERPAEEKLDALPARDPGEHPGAPRSRRGSRGSRGSHRGARPHSGGGDGDECRGRGGAGLMGGIAGRGHGPGARTSSDRISGRRGPRIYLLAPHEILWFEAEGELVFARSGAHRYLVSRTLAELEASLDPRQFFRCHRSFIVNLSAIAEIVPRTPATTGSSCGTPRGRPSR
jgi:DNA-binding LytR/AlgR family response regulator